MTRRVDSLAFTSLALSLALLCQQIVRPAAAADDWALWLLDGISAELSDKLLRQRSDVNIEINQREVARGYSLPGCDGLLLVAVLPSTAQGWPHIAPRLDLSAFRLRYAYAGVLHERVPRFARLRDRLFAELASREQGAHERIVALAERGGCGLLPAAASSLEELASGVTTPNEVGGFSRLINQEDI